MKLPSPFRNMLPLPAIGGALAALVLPLSLRAQTVAAGSADPGFSNTNNTEGSVIQVATQRDGKIVALGSFPGKTTQTSFARLNADGTEDTTFIRLGLSIPGGNATAFAIQPDGKIVYVGTGASDGDTTAAVGRITASGGKDADFAPGSVPSTTISSFHAIALQSDGKIFVGGNFASYNGQPYPGIARLNTDGSLDTTFVPPSGGGIAFSRVLAVAVQPDSRVLVAGNLNYNGDSIQGLLRLNADGSQDTTFSVVLLDQLTSINHIPLLVQPSGKIVLGGDFNVVAGSAHPYLTRLKPDGSLDTTFFAAVDGPVLSLAGQGGFDDLIIGGYFTNVSGTPRLNVARLDGNGVLDPAFDPGTGPGGGGTFDVKTVAIQADGRVLAGGSFAGFGTATRDNLARLLNNFTGASIGFGIPGTSNLWLAGTAPGTTSSTGQDTLINATPSLIQGVNLVAGGTLNIIAQGGVVNDPANPVNAGPDGGEFLGATFATHPAENGIAALTAPYNSLVGVFLDDSSPTAAGAPPAALDFSGAGSAGGINAATITPALRQPFFIGDGFAQDGETQKFIVPAGATRLYLGSFDPSDNENNTGSFGGNVLVVSGTTGGGGTGLSATTLKVNGSDQPTDVTPGTGVSFAATQDFSPSDAVTVRVQSAPAATGPWTDVPGAVLPFVGSGTFVGSSSAYPTAAGTYFRAVATAAGVTGESGSNAVGPFFGSQPPASTGGKLFISAALDRSTSDGGGTTAIPGDKLFFSFVLQNTGKAAATGINITSGFINGTKFKSADNGGKLDPGNSSNLILPKFDLAPGDSRTFIVKAKVPAKFSPGLPIGYSIRSITADAPTPAITGLDQVNAAIAPLLLAPYQTRVTSNPGVSPGGLLTFQFTTKNLSSDTISGVSSTIHIPAGTTFNSANMSDGTAIGGKPDGSGYLTLALRNLGAGESIAYSVSVRVPYDTAPGSTLTLDGTVLQIGQTTYAEPGQTVTLSPQPASNPPSLSVAKYLADATTLQGIFVLEPNTAIALQAQYPALQIFKNGSIDPAAVSLIGQGFNPTVGVNNDASNVNAPGFTVGLPSGKVPAPFVTFAVAYTNNGATDATGVVIDDPVPAGFAYSAAVAQTASTPHIPGNPLPPPYAFLNGKALTASSFQVSGDGRTLRFKVGKIKAGASGLILYQLQVLADGATPVSGPGLGSVVQVQDPVLTTPLLSQPVGGGSGIQLLAVGDRHASVETTTPAGNVGKTAKFNVLYFNDGAKKAKDLKILVPTPANATPYRAAFLNSDLTERGQNNARGEFIEDRLDANGNKVFHLGAVKPDESGFVQIEFLPVAGVSPVAVHAVASLSPDTFGATTFAEDQGGFTTRAVQGRRERAANAAGIGASSGATVQADDSRFPRFYIQQHAPFAVRAGENYSVIIAAAILNEQDAFGANLLVPIPAGIDFVSFVGQGAQGTFQGRFLNQGGQGFAEVQFGSINPHTAVAAVLTLKAQAGSGGKTIVNSGTALSAPAPALDFINLTANSTQTYVLRSNETLAQMGSQILGKALAPYGGSAANAANLTGKLTINSGITTVVNATGISFQTGGLVVPIGYINNVPQLVASGGGNLVAQGAGNLIAQGAGNLVAQGAGNLITISGMNGASILSGLLSPAGSGVVAGNLANILHGGGDNLISLDGAKLIGQDGGGLISKDISLVVSNDGASFASGLSSLISQDGGGLIGQDGGGLIGQDGGGLLATSSGNLIAQGAGNILAGGGGNLVAQGGGNLAARGAGNAHPGDRVARSARVTRPRALATGQPAQGSPSSSVGIHVTDTDLVIVGGGGIGN